MSELDAGLLKAAGRGDTAAIEDLIQEGADPNCRDQWGNTPLSAAAWGGYLEAMDLLHKKGADIGRECYENNDLLCHAAFNAQVDSVKWLLSEGADPKHVSEKTGESPLHFAISKKDASPRTEIVRVLVEAGADVNLKTIAGEETGCFMRDAYLKGETPLHRAAAYGDKEVVQILLEAGADPSIKDANGDSPISWGGWHLWPNDILGLLPYGEVPGWHGCPNPNLKGKDLC